jgi:hypothetical protein
MRDIFGTVGSYLLSLVGLVAVGGAIYLAMTWYKAGNAVSDLNSLSSAIQAAYAQQPTFSTVTNTVANTAGWTPKTMNAGGGTINNQWGGAVTVAVDGANAAEFDVTEAGVPSSACEKLIQTSSVEALSVNGAAVTIPVDAATASTDCAQASNTMVFVFGH